MNRAIIAGGRHFNDFNLFEMIVSDIFNDLGYTFENTEIISGHCDGVDKLGESFAEYYGFDCKIFPAHWDKYGKSAGIKRNIEMIEYAKQCDNPTLIAFWDGESRGTKFTIEQARKNNFNVEIINYRFEDDSISLFEGVTQDNTGKFIFNFDDDNSDDIVHLKVNKIFRTKKNNSVYYYGYRVDSKNPHTKEFLKYVKTNDALDSNAVNNMLDSCAERFVSEVDGDNFDFIVTIPSSSNLVKKLASKLSYYSDKPQISLNKLSNNRITFDWDLLRKHSKYNDKDFNKLKSYMIQFLPNDNKIFSISKHIPPRYRQYLNPIFELSNEQPVEDILNAKNILIIDDNATTGKSFGDVAKILRNVGYDGDFTLFSFIKNY